jgi:selenide, water dikinase
VRDLVLVGGGHSHVAVLKAFGVRPPTDARLTLISRDALTPSSGMLPGYLTGDYSEAESHIDLRRLSRFAGARLCQTAAAGLDLANRLVQCEGRPPVAFDLLSIDIGSSPSSGAIAGAEHALPVKPVRGFIDGWAEIERRILVAGGPFRLLIIGGGVGGIELCLSLQHRLRGRLASGGRPIGINFAIVTDSAVPLPQHSPALRARYPAAQRSRCHVAYRSQRASA